LGGKVVRSLWKMMQFPPKNENRTPMWSSYTSFQRNWKSGSWGNIWTTMLITLFTIAKTWTQPKCPDRGIEKENSCDNMHDSGRHHTKWNKPDIEGEILHVPQTCGT
jgi:hypothetical protein